MTHSKVPNGSQTFAILWGFLGLLALALIVYGPVLSGAFIWDDGQMVYNNPFVQSHSGLAPIWSGHDNDYLPVTSTLFWFEWRLFGQHPAGYRVINILLHVGSSLLIWRILKRLKIPGSAIAAAIYCVHPVCVETVAWVAELKNTLSVFLALLSVHLFLYARPPGQTQKNQEVTWNRTLYLISIIAFVLALLSKISVVMLPFLLIALINIRKTAEWLRLAPYFASSLLLGLLNVWFQHHHAMAAIELEQGQSLAARVVSGGYALWFYCAKIFLPINLIPIYPRWDVDPKSAVDWAALSLWILLLAVLFALSRKSQLARAAFFGSAFFTIAAIPVLGFVNISYFAHSQVSDHLQYFPMIGIITFAAWTIDFLANRKNVREKSPGRKPPVPNANLAIRITVVIVGLLALLSFQQSRLYGNPEQLWNYNITKNPHAAMAWANLAEIDAGHNQLDLAINHYRESLRLDPDNLNVREALGQLLMVRGRGEEAANEFRAIVEKDPRQTRAHNNLGVIFSATGQTESAITEFEHVIQYAPENEAAHVNLGCMLERLGEFDKATAEFKKAQKINPDNSAAQEGLSRIQQKRAASR